MGKGIALQFRRAYPAMFDAYKAACQSGEVRIGQVMVWATGAAVGPRFIVNFPTKRHWRSPSHMDYIEKGLVDLVRVVQERGITSLAVPPLGAGNGGLPWARVRAAIAAALGPLQDVEVLVYEPVGAPGAHEMTSAAPRQPLNEHRAAFLDLLGRYRAAVIDARVSLIEVQKLMYFLQEAGQPLRLRFGRGPYGPYADNLRHVLIASEGGYTIGFGDGSTPPPDSDLSLVPGAWEEAERLLVRYPDTRARIDQVMALTEGFDSMYGLELLATVHWLIRHEKADPDDLATLTHCLASWTGRKAELYTPPHVRTARDHLRDMAWI
jgi:O-acetyl-ADP-ribose deacetylase (regulator of RNase III)